MDKIMEAYQLGKLAGAMKGFVCYVSYEKELVCEVLGKEGLECLSAVILDATDLQTEIQRRLKELIKEDACKVNSENIS